MKHLLRSMCLVVLIAVFSISVTGCPPSQPVQEDSWSWKINNNILEIGYGNPVAGWPQLVALHLNTGALRMVYGPESGWGPTVYMPPALWTDGDDGERFYLGAPIDAEISTKNDDIFIEIEGVIGGLAFSNLLRFSPPQQNQLIARITATTSGSVPLASRRPGEAFQPVHVASMHISRTEWDSQAVRVNDVDFIFPVNGWVLDAPGLLYHAFTMLGGSSEWKPNAPNITVHVDQTMTLQGWVTESHDPNDDNVGFWCATDEVLNKWEYRIFAEPYTE